MERIAFKRSGDWFSGAWRELTEDFAALVPFGGLYLGLIWGSLALTFAVSCVAAIIPFAGLLTPIITFVLQTIVEGVCFAGMAGVSLARIHGRTPAFVDFQQDLGTHVQAVLGLLIVKGIAIVAMIVGVLPGLALMIPGFMDNNDALMIAGGLVMLFVTVPAMLLVQTLTFFTVPLIVEKKLDFWSAFLTSIDCTRRDLAGLMIFSLAWYLTMLLTYCCTFTIGVIFFAPWLFLIQMHAYRDYFGLNEDRHGLAPAPVTWDPYRAHEYDAYAGYGGARGYGAEGYKRDWDQGIQREEPPFAPPPAPPTPEERSEGGVPPPPPPPEDQK